MKLLAQRARHRLPLAAIVLFLVACQPSQQDIALKHSLAGDPQRGRLALYDHGCGTCHRIDGVRGANGRVGPPLTDVAERWYLGGVLPNNPDNMTRWIQDPRRFSPHTVMPRLGVSEADARDMVAYLYLPSGLHKPHRNAMELEHDQ